MFATSTNITSLVVGAFKHIKQTPAGSIVVKRRNDQHPHALHKF